MEGEGAMERRGSAGAEREEGRGVDRQRWLGELERSAPGVALCALLTAGAYLVQEVERRVTGAAWVEVVVLAILLGAAVRTAWAPGARWRAGIGVSAKQLLEVAVVLLGASVSVPMLRRAGAAVVVGIVGVVVIGIGTSYVIGRSLGLRHRLALLIACGNSICGNSAIAAVAPVIGAEPDDVASAIAFTAVLGVVMVIGLPVLSRAIGLSSFQHGVLAGLTVYAVPQVLAATMPVSAVSAQAGTLVKLVRVLMLGPVVVLLSLRARREARRGGERAAMPPAGEAAGARRGASSTRLVPWFIVGFVAMAALRGAGAIPTRAMPAIQGITTWLTVISMVALGLGVDVRAVARVGKTVTAAVTGSLAVLVVVSLVLIRVLHIA